MDSDGTLLRDSPFWRKKFAHATKVRDANKDGWISRDDFDLIVTRYKALPEANQSHAETLTAAMDSLCKAIGFEGYTKMSYEEFEERHFQKMKSDLENGTSDKLFGKMFDTVDANGDGSIDLSEWRVHYECCGIPVEHAKASFDAMDTNHDGVVSREEFLAYYLEFFFSTEDTLNSSILYGPLD